MRIIENVPPPPPKPPRTFRLEEVTEEELEAIRWYIEHSVYPPIGPVGYRILHQIGMALL